ncbi:MAG: NAD(+)/NADH kinase [Acidimicrobiales bacterium]|nr:NAD(+)/NADH kinase [Acidimicrobiales bacterium]
MSTFVVVLHHQRPRAAELARLVARELLDGGHQIRIPAADAEVAGLGELGVPDAELASGADVALSLGGDGTMLRTVDLVAAAGVPVLGVNVGQLGYLTEVEPAALDAALVRLGRGDYAIEERMMLSVTAEPAGKPASTATGLNEAVLEKTPMGHTVRLGVSIDGEFFTTYAADGLIVATPTGSTAYAFSARGPIVAPEHRALLLTPVSPHMLFDRTLVLEPTTVLRLEVLGGRPATLSVDGRNLGTLVEGDVVSCTAAAPSARLVVFGPRNFHRILKAKFGLNDR